MRRNDREIKEKQEIEAIIQQAQVCRIGLSENGVPNIVPVHFGYKDSCVYFHSASEGRKLDIIHKNNRVCFEMDIDHVLKPSDSPCRWSAGYRAVIGFGHAFILQDIHEKSAALNIITRHYGCDWRNFSGEELAGTDIIKIEISGMTGKKAGY